MRYVPLDMDALRRSAEEARRRIEAWPKWKRDLVAYRLRELSAKIEEPNGSSEETDR